MVYVLDHWATVGIDTQQQILKLAWDKEMEGSRFMYNEGFPHVK